MPITALRPTLLGALVPALVLLLGLPSGDAQALGLGRPLIHSALGKPLDVSVPLVLAGGEQLTDSCLRAEVVAGDARVPAGLLQLRIEGEPGEQHIRLRSQARIDEPTLRITLAVGCPLRLTREFNVLVDPPAQVAVAPQPDLPTVPAPAPPSAPAAEAVPPAQLEAAPPPRPRPRARPRPVGSRLALERPEVLVAEAPRPRAPSASAPEMELTPEIEAQISQLEQTVAQLRAELLARQQAEMQAASAAMPAAAVPGASAVAQPAAVIRARATPYRDPMTWLLTLALGLLAGSAAFYLSRWRDQRSRSDVAPWRTRPAVEAAAGAAPTPAAPAPGMAPPVGGLAATLPDESQHQITRPQPRPMLWPPAPAPLPVLPVPAEPSMRATQPLPSQAAAAPLLSSELTIADELLDLQQQVEFLRLLGQQDAAADLLATRLAQGHVGAMPHLLLMELSQQRGDPEVFGEQARQFEQRFGAPAPQWTQSLAQGRSLDGCPSVIAHLQVVWADPAETMTLLRELLAQGGGPGVPRFDLPAYRDLLALYGVARDLFEAGLRSDEVDLMLPMDSPPGG